MIANKFFFGAIALAGLVATACGGSPTGPTSAVLAQSSSAGQAVKPGAGAVNGGGVGGGTGGAPQADIQLSGSASTGTPAPGATYSYTFQVKNSGAATSLGVSFQTVLPSELPPASFQGVTNSDGSACTVGTFVDSNQVYFVCSLGDMVVGAQKTITIVVSAPVTLGTISVQATAYPSDVITNPLADKNLGDNTKTITVTVR